MSDNPVAQVGQHSRESGRVPVHVLADRLLEEKDSLIVEKRRIEAALSEADSKKRDSLAQLYRRGINRSEAYAATNEIESAYRRERSKLIREKDAVENRLNDIKNRLHGGAVREDVAVLKRIESLLVEIRDRLPS